MENKYFTPEIEDIRVGYECEIECNSKWKPIIITAIDSEENSIGTDSGSYWLTAQNIKTPYLTKEQIETEGWERLEFEREELYGYKKDNYFLVFNEKVRTINIILRDPSKESEISWSLQTSPERFKFFCECKCINTFRTICKLLNIK
jgi:hypothetical protein